LSMTNLQSKVRETIRRYEMFSSGDRVLVAVSGGPDSVALLHLLSGLKGELGLSLEMAHLQHGIRGAESRQDALFVAGLAQRLALPFHLREVDLPRTRAERGKGNIEAMGRDERYRFFAALAEERGIQKVATAHTRDDQVETLLMWLLRGSGKRGLGGMPPVRRLIPTKEPALGGAILVRPLIEVSREEVVNFLAAEGLESRTDKTNLDPVPLRNWIRLRLLPQVRAKFDPAVDERLIHLADILREEDQTLDRMARQDLELVLREKNLMRDSFLQLHRAMQRRLLRLWLGATLGDIRGFGFQDVEEALRFIESGPPQGRLSVGRGWELVKQYGAVYLEKRRKKQRPACYSYDLPRRGELVISEAGMKVQSSPGISSPDTRPRDSLEAVFDLASLPETLTVRNFRHGDRFQPLGMKGHKKLKDLFIEKKVPLAVRATLPLFLAGGEILWIPGYGRSDVAKVGAETREVLRIRVEFYDR